MSIVAEKYDHVIGVDTHAKTHTYAVIDAKNSAVVKVKQFPTHQAGLARALAWIAKYPGLLLAAVEGTGSYGRLLTTALIEAGIDVAEVKPPPKATRAGEGKSDPIDAQAAARGVLGTHTGKLLTPRASGPRNAIRVLLAGRRATEATRTRLTNALHALLRTNDLGIDARATLSTAEYQTIAGWRARTGEDLDTRICREEATRMAKEIRRLKAELNANYDRLEAVLKEFFPDVLDIYGVGPISGAQLVASYSHKGRVRSEAAFAKLAGTAPLPASSGNTTRHRLSRYGDRQLNSALTRILNTRLSHDKRTQDYRDERLDRKVNNSEIRRTLKRYIARETYRKLEHIMA